MRQKLSRALLTYGVVHQPPLDVPIIDMTEPLWEIDLDLKDGLFYCLAGDQVYAKKKVPTENIKVISSVDEISAPQETGEVTAVRIGEIVVSAKTHPATKKCGVWLSPYHLELISDLLDLGVELELLDEQNNVVAKPKKGKK